MHKPKYHISYLVDFLNVDLGETKIELAQLLHHSVISTLRSAERWVCQDWTSILNEEVLLLNRSAFLCHIRDATKVSLGSLVGGSQ